MWISRDEYEHLKANLKCVENHCTIQHDRIRRLVDELHIHFDTINELKKKVELYKSKSEEYKQKYADEVQKRLELVKLIENTP